jgi:hydroxymethylglutaryl-CoA lyase
MATPGRVTALVGETRMRLPDAELNLHFHNTRGTGLANVLAALQLGGDDFDASVGGLGGCPYAPGATGNVCTEDLVHMVEDMGIDTGINLLRCGGPRARPSAWSAARCRRRSCAPVPAPPRARP